MHPCPQCLEYTVSVSNSDCPTEFAVAEMVVYFQTGSKFSRN